MHLYFLEEFETAGAKVQHHNSFFAKIWYGAWFDVCLGLNCVTNSNLTKAERITQQRENLQRIMKMYRNLPSQLSISFAESSREIIKTRNSEEKVTRYENSLLIKIIMYFIRGIKLAKLWNSRYFKSDTSYRHNLRSYALEIIICWLYDRFEAPDGPTLFYKMLDILKRLL